VARAYGVNANLVFNWRRLYQARLLGGSDRAKLLPVKVTPESLSRWTGPLREPGSSSSSSVGAIHIQLQDVQVRIEAAPIRLCSECCWSACGHDRAADKHADLD
jgi:hypothetical protein